MRFIFILLFIFQSPVFLFSNIPETLILNEGFSKEFFSVAPKALIAEDKTNKLEFYEIRKNSLDTTNSFKLLGEENANLGFTSSSFWIKFIIKNGDAYTKKFLLETARPLTNIAQLYIVYKNGLTVENKSGDGIPFGQRQVSHRKILFPVQFRAGEELTFYLHLQSDGEVISLPIKLWEPEKMMKKDYDEQYLFGLYYGILLFVIIIYSFFYFALKEKSFLYYVLYVFFLFFLQLSLDGLAFQYLWPNQVWWANHIVVMSATLTAIFVLLYAQSFLKIKENLRGFNSVFNIFIALCFICLSLTFCAGKLYSLSFPLTNFLSLMSGFLVLITILASMKNKKKVSWFFTLAFVSLISGAIIFILSNLNVVPVTFFTEHSLKFGSAVEIIFLSLSMANTYREIQRENEKLIREQNIVLEKKVSERTAEVVKQKEIIEEKNKDILDSIHYAKRIQRALLASDLMLKRNLSEYFVLYQPKDIVSGDFYWAQETNGKFLLSVCDCTGHGVPGAFMSLLNISFLNEVTAEKKISQPDLILNHVRESIINALNTEGNEESKDGMDSIICCFDFNNLTLEAACANNPLWIVRSANGKDESGMSISFYEIKPDKMPVGKHVNDKNSFTLHKYNLQKGDSIYIFSDGYPDQFGGPKGKKFKYAQLEKLLLTIQEKSMEEQKEILNKTINNWRGSLEQVDDICIIGLRM